eukprot:CAMPEP_0195520594 /NCGR_PEP_ID=MMETSP0794_2-20130614/17243_1 /TAXON_ID=515487 /ORGANISM="Stephanopyxis turris, Strain CCMP 815" /LENGTH=145 /DNA_ID=CAMNT_0040649983 /DNA_START=60 /DNA_END=497 /DNA_ORIENTATION=+
MSEDEKCKAAEALRDAIVDADSDTDEASEALRDALVDADTDDITPAFRDALHSIFDSLDVDKDGILNTKELHSLAQICNGEDFADDELEQIFEFHECQGEGDEKGLTKEGLVDMFFVQAGARPEDVWADLRALGFDESLQRKSKD